MSRMRALSEDTADEQRAPRASRRTAVRGTPPSYTVLDIPPPNAPRTGPRAPSPPPPPPGIPPARPVGAVAGRWLEIVAAVMGTGKVARVDPRPGVLATNLQLAAFVGRYRMLFRGYLIRTHTEPDGSTLVWAEPDRA
jgi:hypothetical protein